MGLFPVTMLEVTFITLMEDFPKLIIKLAETGDFMPKEATSFENLPDLYPVSKLEKVRQFEVSFNEIIKLSPNPKEKFLTKVKNAYKKQLNLEPLFENWLKLEDIEKELEGLIESFQREIKSLQSKYNLKKGKVEERQLFAKGFRLLENMKPYEVTDKNDVLLGILTTSKEDDCYEFLAKASVKEVVALEKNQFFLFAQDKKAIIQSIRDSLSVVRWIEFEYDGPKHFSKLEIGEEIEKQLKIEKEELKHLETKLNEFAIQNKQTLIALKLSIESYSNLLRLYISSKKTERTVIFQGWVSQKDLKKIQKITSSFPETVLLSKKPEEETKNIPTLPSRNFIMRSFQSVVGLYGLPSQKEVDPTIFFVFTFSIFYGIMFGDAGHGLIFIIFGLLGVLAKGLRKSLRQMFILVFFIGIASFIMGGFIFGEFFGYEISELLNIHSFFGFKYPILSPKQNLIEIFNLSLIIGAIHIILGLTLRTINQLKRKELEHLLKETTAQVFLYGAIIYLLNVLGIITFGDVTIPVFVGLIALGLGVGLALLGQGIASIFLRKKPKEIVKSFFSGMGMGLMNLLESFSSFISNTISYGRLLAMLIAHVVFLSVINILAAQFQLVILQILILILGNIFVIVLEGVLVFVQTLRLHFYEFFSKFYEGSGIPYKPIFIFNKTMDMNKYG
ncbi:MAG: V-type ATP synthase subunit I [Candidatus Heimdallarchaeaceae archaeon]